jgi:hypothetical protein
MRSSGLVDKVHYPVTASADEWANELLNLDQLLVEGFKVDALREKAVALGRNPDKGFRSLKLLEECLIGLGLNEVDAAEVVGPFKELHDLRSKMKGHVSGAEGAEIKRKILTENGSYKNHFLKLLTSCDKSIGIVLDILK